MSLQMKMWNRAGVAMLAASASGIVDAAAAPDSGLAGLLLAQTVTEGGEGGEAGGLLPSQYRLMLSADRDPVYDGAGIAASYVQQVHAAYTRSAQSARRLQAAIGSLLARADASALASARAQWIQARRDYLVTEAFRFYEGPIDAPERDGMPAGPESRINAWPLNEAVIDGVEGDSDAGLVNALDVPLTRETIIARDQVSDEADVTTGWHAIEFLLWGQDRSDDGPGDRAVADFTAGTPPSDRRRAYVTLLAALLVDDLDALAAQWDTNREGSYAQTLLALPPHEVIGRQLTGAALLAAHELSSERLAVALDSGSQEDEQSCFSDTTWQDFVWGLAGIKRVYYGVGATTSIATELRRVDPTLAAEMELRFADAERRVAAINDPFDRVLRSAPDDPMRSHAEAAVVALQRLGAGLRDSGRALGVLVIVPGA